MKIMFCIPGKTFSGDFLKSWDNLTQMLLSSNIDYVLKNEYSSVVYYARNMCLNGDNLSGMAQLPFNGEDYDYIMWIDSDIIFKPRDFFKLLNDMETNKSINILSGLYKTEDDVHYTAVKKWDVEYFGKHGTFPFLKKKDIDSFNNKIVPVTYVGFGFVMMRHGVIEKMEYPWFKPIYHHMVIGNITIDDFSSEDVSFCLTAASLGFTIYIESSIIVEHEKVRRLS